MKQEYDNIDSFIKDLKEESVKQLIIDMGYLTEDDFYYNKCSCVFHKGDRTPSLQITDNFFKCYGCNAKGDLIQWIQLYENLSFIESIKKISDFLNIKIKDNKISLNSKLKNKLIKEWEIYLDNFNNNIKNNKLLLEKSKKYFPLQVGYDIKEDRIVLATKSKIGNILGFTKRRLNDNIEENNPKWKHSNLKESLISEVHNIFNLDKAYKDIKDKKYLYIVEGPGDVASMLRANYINTIAILGTSNFSKEVLKILEPINSFYFVLDNDKAGKKSLKDSLLLLSELNPFSLENSKVILLPENKDPGDLDIEELSKYVENPINAIDYYIENETLDNNILFYNNCSSEIIKPLIFNKFSNHNNYNIKQTNEILNYKIKNNNQNNKNNLNLYKEQLLATIGKSSNIEIEPLNIDEEKAKRILKLRFNEIH